MRSLAPILATALAAALTGAALAQARLPVESRSERQIQDTNRALELQQRQQGAIQQNQFELNQLRGQLQREQLFPPPGTTRICAPGQIGC